MATRKRAGTDGGGAEKPPAKARAARKRAGAAKAEPAQPAAPAPAAAKGKRKSAKARPGAAGTSGKRSSDEIVASSREIAERNRKLNTITVDAIRDAARTVHDSIGRLRKPDMNFPVRALSNVSYSQKRGYFEIGKQKKTRTLTVNTVKNFAQTLRMMGLAKELVETNDFATKRDAYYQSKNWGDAKFDEQPESDTVMDDIEAMFSMHGVSREHLRFTADEGSNGSVAGRLLVLDPDRETGQIERIDCTRFGTGAYSIPSSVEHLGFETDADFVLVIETSGMFQRLQNHKYWQTANCILVVMGGVPRRACRRFVRKLSDECNLPVYAFVDCDPYGISNIYRTLKVGSGNAAHLSRFFCVPQARYLGVTPQDIVEYDLPTHPLQDVDVKRAKDALRNDPFFQAQEPWQAAMNQLLKMGVRAEQQALAKWGLNYVMERYLPAKLERPDRFLP
jgi:DNA topoisomerase VI subunit A